MALIVVRAGPTVPCSSTVASVIRPRVSCSDSARRRGSGGGFSLVEHPIPARGLCAPLHRHTREDEYSFVLEGRMGAQLGDDVVYAEAGDLVFKPRGQWHTFRAAGDAPCRILEIISPGGFEEFFAELGRGATPAEAGARYGLQFDFDSIPRLCAEHGLNFTLPGE